MFRLGLCILFCAIWGFSSIAFAAEEYLSLVVQKQRPTMAEFFSATRHSDWHHKNHDPEEIVCNQVKSSAITNEGPQLVNALEYAFPRVTYALLGRDSSYVADLLEYLQLATGQYHRIVRLNASRTSFGDPDKKGIINIDPQYPPKFLIASGLLNQVGQPIQDFVILDATRWEATSQSRALIHAAYSGMNREEQSSYFRRMNAVSISKTVVSNDNWRITDITPNLNLDRFFNHDIRTDNLVNGPDRILRFNISLTYLATRKGGHEIAWHDKFKKFIDLAGIGPINDSNFYAPPGDLMPIQDRKDILCLMNEIQKGARTSTFLEGLVNNAKKYRNVELVRLALNSGLLLLVDDDDYFINKAIETGWDLIRFDQAVSNMNVVLRDANTELILHRKEIMSFLEFFDSEASFEKLESKLQEIMSNPEVSSRFQNIITNRPSLREFIKKRVLTPIIMDSTYPLEKIKSILLLFGDYAPKELLAERLKKELILTGVSNAGLIELYHLQEDLDFSILPEVNDELIAQYKSQLDNTNAISQILELINESGNTRVKLFKDKLRGNLQFLKLLEEKCLDWADIARVFNSNLVQTELSNESRVFFKDFFLRAFEKFSYGASQSQLEVMLSRVSFDRKMQEVFQESDLKKVFTILNGKRPADRSISEFFRKYLNTRNTISNSETLLGFLKLKFEVLRQICTSLTEEDEIVAFLLSSEFVNFDMFLMTQYLSNIDEVELQLKALLRKVKISESNLRKLTLNVRFRNLNYWTPQLSITVTPRDYLNTINVLYSLGEATIRDAITNTCEHFVSLPESIEYVNDLIAFVQKQVGWSSDLHEKILVALFPYINSIEQYKNLIRPSKELQSEWYKEEVRRLKKRLGYHSFSVWDPHSWRFSHSFKVPMRSGK